MNTLRRNLVSYAWILSIGLYLGRSLAEPLKYPFLFSFGLLILCFAVVLILESKRPHILKFSYAIKEFILAGLFVAVGILLSSKIEPLSLKGLINFLGILVFFYIYVQYRQAIRPDQLLKGWLSLAIIIAIIGLVKWLNFLFDLEWQWLSSFYNRGTSLGTDYNIYSFYYILTIFVFLYGLAKKTLQTKPVINLSVLILFILNAALSGSRRGIIMLVLFFLASIVYTIRKRKQRNGILRKNLLYLNIIILAIAACFIALIPFRSRIIQNTTTKAKISKTVFRYSTIIKPGITYKILYDKFWPMADSYSNDRTEWNKYATYNNVIDNTMHNAYLDQKNEYWLYYAKKENSDNLIYNGDFAYGKDLWTVDAPDSIRHDLIHTEYGSALRVSRNNGQGYWPLKYGGRKIQYYQGVRYTIKFKFRVVKGQGVPFSIGWWLDEGEGYLNNLPGTIQALSNGWYEFTASYTFKEDQRNPQTFMNSQSANTVVDFTDIELSCEDALDRPHYVDQILNPVGSNLLYNSNFENGHEFWGSYTPDTIINEIIDTQDGKALRVTRNDGTGYWPLTYQGREIFYHKGITYFFRFKFRVIQGQGTPFNIGWWLNNEEINPYDLHKEVFPLGDGWNECIVLYRFNNNYYGHIYAFMNSQQPNTIIDFADIELICNDTLDSPMYADEHTEYIDSLEKSRLEEELANTKEAILATRIARWKYALKLWKNDYTWRERIIGGGFDYLSEFGEEFHPQEDRIDYPHNPIISAFLYSGITGGVFYIYFLVLSFWYYWKYRKQQMLFLILYLITFVFIFISSDSHFNVPVFAMLSLVPFITRHIVNEKEQKNPA